MSPGCEYVAVHWAAKVTSAFTAAVTVFACSAPGATGTGGGSTRPPTRAERAALTNANYDSAVPGDSGVSFIRVLVQDSDYAIVGWAHAADPANWLHTSLFRRVRSQWRLLYWIEGPRGHQASADGACAVAPSAVVFALYHYRCSFTAAQLHAAPATATQARDLQAVLSRYYAGSTLGPQHLGRACISRVDTHWAAASGTGLVWFRETQSGWRVAYENGDPGPRPPHAILLSLGSCVGYFPSDYYKGS